MFQNASYGFTVFSIITPLIVIVSFILSLFYLSAFNVLATLSFKMKMDGDRRIFFGNTTILERHEALHRRSNQIVSDSEVAPN